MGHEEEPSKMFTFEDGQQLMQNSMDSQGSGQQQPVGPSRTQQQENMGHLMFVQSGRNHSLHLTRDGDVFSYGSGVQCAVGHGGAKSAFTPTILKPLRDKRII
jgi:alpha-tubulin suppressor-like RCC1 family protein